MSLVFKIFLLSFIESISEFLPISSSSHLIFADKFFLQTGLIDNDFFMIFVQLGALLALTFYYRRDIKDIFKETWQLKKEGYIIIFNLLNAFIISGIVGFLIKKTIHIDFLYSAYALIFFGVIMISLQKRQNYGRIMHLWEIPPFYAFLIGISQGLSVFPGVSRLGITLIVGILLNLKKDIAIKFSFLLSLPTMLAASIYELIKLIVQNKALDLPSNLIGFSLSLFLSLIFIRPLIFLLQIINIKYFGYYRIIFATLILFFWRAIN